MWIDSHCHIDKPDFDNDRAAMLERAHAVGISEFICVAASDTIAGIESTLAFAQSRNDTHATVGVHPHHADAVDEDWWPALDSLAKQASVVAIGETGLDAYYQRSPRAQQIDSFKRHLALAAAHQLPVVCHIRDAHEDALAILADAQVTAIIHCFTGGPAEAEAYLTLGAYLSFSGVVTFKGKSAAPNREAAALVPLDRLLLETDCPYLAPVPHRGQRNEPSFLPATAACVAEQKGVSLEALATSSVAATRAAFRLGR